MAETINIRSLKLRRPILWGGIWLISLLVWYPIWAIVGFLVWEDPSLVPRKPIWGITLAALSLYPIIAIVAASFSFAKYYLSIKWALLVSLLSPVAVAGVIFVITSIATATRSYTETRRINEFWNNPPPRIGEFEDTKLKAFAPLEPYAEFFILPDSVEASDIAIWNGTTLIFSTDLPPQRVANFYDESFKIVGFRKSASYPRLREDNVDFDTTFVYVQKNNQQRGSLAFTIVIKKTETTSTIVRLEPCKPGLFNCLETRIGN